MQVGLKMLKMLAKSQKKHQVKKLVHKNHHLALALHLPPKTQVFSGYLRFSGKALNVDLKGLRVVTKTGHS